MFLTVVSETALIRAEGQVLPALSSTCFMISMLCPQFHLGLMGPSQAPHRTLWSMGSHFSQMSPSGETSVSHRVHTLPHIYTTPHRTCVTPLHAITGTHASFYLHKHTYEHMQDFISNLSKKKKKEGTTCEVQFLSCFFFFFFFL